MKGYLNKKYLLSLIFLVFLQSMIFSQLYIPSDPFNLYKNEIKNYVPGNSYNSFSLRPIYYTTQNENSWSIKVRSELFFNNNAPNLENMSDRWVGKGVGHFSSLNISHSSKHLFFSAEPFVYINENREYEEPQRIGKFTRLNDQRPHTKSPYLVINLRELQIYAKYRGYGVGYSNANMWWGNGIHSSIMMTNNTSGFGHFYLGTIEEKRYKNFGFNARYILTKLDNSSLYKPYYNAFAINFSLFFDNVYTIGITKSAILGGNHPLADDVKLLDAATAVLYTGLIPSSWSSEDFKKNWSYDDNAAVLFITADIKRSKLKLFFEYGRNDIAWDFKQFFVYPEFSGAFHFGTRKYGLFNYDQLFFGIEYLSLILPRLQHIYLLGDWYDRELYDYKSYNGRRWVAHSGSDSDDFYFTLGWIGEKIEIIPSFNYERYGLSYSTISPQSGIDILKSGDITHETKIEFRMDLRFIYKDYKINIYGERELLFNLKSSDKKRKGLVFWIGIEKDITSLFSNILK